MKWIKTTMSSVVDMSKLPKKQKQFGLLLIIVLLIYIGISFFKHGFEFNEKQVVALTLLIVVTLITFLFKRLLFPLLFIWLLFGELMGKVTSTLILLLIYFFVFTPISLILNRFNKKKRYKADWYLKSNDINYENLS